MKFEVSLFRFDHQSDYLPYYTKHIVQQQKEETLLDILNTIHEDQPFGFENNEDFIVVVNGLYTHCNITIGELKAEFGKELCIEPMSIRRSYSDLLINENDFNEKFQILFKFTGLDMLPSYKDQEILKKYQSYKIYFYASNTLNYETNYIGDALILLAHDLIEKFPKDEAEILKTLNAYDVGLEYHTSLKNRVYNLDENVEKRIQSLKEALNLSAQNQNFKVNHTHNLNFGSFESSSEIKYDFNQFNLAYYEGLNPCKQTLSLLSNLKSKSVNFDSMQSDLALDSFHVNPTLTYKLASTVMLDAFDQNADLLIVDSDDLFYLFDYNRKELSKVSGREINIPVIHKNELQKLATGQHGSVKDTLDKHIVKPELI